MRFLWRHVLSIFFWDLVRYGWPWIWESACLTAEKAWIFAAFVGLLPGSLFVFTYVNCDALAVFSTAVIVYAWVRYLTEGWTYKNCIILAIGVAVCTLSYYNAYGFILCSIFFFGITLFMEAKQKGNYGDFAKKGLLVCVIVMILAAWWFVRNAILYDGDFLGMNASSICAEKYAKPAYKPSEKQTPQMAGYTLWDMLNQGFPEIRRIFVGGTCQ